MFRDRSCCVHMFTNFKITIAWHEESVKRQEASAESAEVGHFLEPQLRFNARFQRSEVMQGGRKAISFA